MNHPASTTTGAAAAPAYFAAAHQPTSLDFDNLNKTSSMDVSMDASMDASMESNDVNMTSSIGSGKKKNCPKKRLKKNIICYKDTQKKLKKLQKLTKKLNMRLTKCSRKRIKKWRKKHKTTKRKNKK